MEIKPRYAASFQDPFQALRAALDPLHRRIDPYQDISYQR